MRSSPLPFICRGRLFRSTVMPLFQICIICAPVIKALFADIDIEHCPNCGGSLKSIACPETCMMDV